MDVCREHDLKQSEVERWMETCLKSGERGLTARGSDEQVEHEREPKEPWAKVGELVLELDAVREWQALGGRDETAF